MYVSKLWKCMIFNYYRMGELVSLQHCLHAFSIIYVGLLTYVCLVGLYAAHLMTLYRMSTDHCQCCDWTVTDHMYCRTTRSACTCVKRGGTRDLCSLHATAAPLRFVLATTAGLRSGYRTHSSAMKNDPPSTKWPLKTDFYVSMSPVICGMWSSEYQLQLQPRHIH